MKTTLKILTVLILAFGFYVLGAYRVHVQEERAQAIQKSMDATHAQAQKSLRCIERGGDDCR